MKTLRSRLQNLQKHIVGLEPEFKNNDIFIDEQSCVSSLDDTLRWYNYCNFNICPRRNDVTSGTYIDKILFAWIKFLDTEYGVIKMDMITSN